MTILEHEKTAEMIAQECMGILETVDDNWACEISPFRLRKLCEHVLTHGKSQILVPTSVAKTVEPKGESKDKK